MLIVKIIAALIIPSAFPTTEISVKKIILSILIIPSYYSEQLDKYSSIVSVSWALCCEALFYLVFSIAIRFKKITGIVFIYIFLVSAVIVGYTLDVEKNASVILYIIFNYVFLNWDLNFDDNEFNRKWI